MNAHLEAEELELYVLGALETEAARRLEWHARGCAPCAERLAEEARLETALRELVPAVRRAPAKVVRLPARPPAQPRRSMPGSLAAAAAILVAVWGLGASRAPMGGGRSMAVAEGGALICEVRAEELVCAGPASAGGSPAEDVCREPIACPVLQSRLR